MRTGSGVIIRNIGILLKALVNPSYRLAYAFYRYTSNNNPRSPFPPPYSLLLLIFFALNISLFGINLDTPPLLAPDLASAPEITSMAAVLLDAQTGTVLYAKNPNEEIPPASLTKLMTIHLVLQAVNEGKASLDDIIPIGTESWAFRQPPRSSLMFLAPGQMVTLREILLGMAIPSGNDAAVAAALRIAPSVADFVAMMNEEARRMGLKKTHFTEPSGISEDNMITAAEFAVFCREYLLQHPESLTELHSVREFAYPKAANVAEQFRSDPKTIVQQNRNTLLTTFPGVDGLKTGYIDEAGYNIALTAKRGGTRLIAIILGAPAHPGGDRIRDRDGERLLSWAFDHFKTVSPQPGSFAPVRLWKGKRNWAELQLAQEPVFTSPRDRSASLEYSVETDNPLIAPLPAHFPVGWLVISDAAGELHRARLFTAEAYQQGNVFKRIWDSIRLMITRSQ